VSRAIKRIFQEWSEDMNASLNTAQKSADSVRGGKAIRTRSRSPEGVDASAFIITDGHGYWCGRSRDKIDKTRKVDFWSTKEADAARMHFYEVAQQIAAGLPMPVQIKRASR
jgi:hypothetical protein